MGMHIKIKNKLCGCKLYEASYIDGFHVSPFLLVTAQGFKTEGEIFSILIIRNIYYVCIFTRYIIIYIVIYIIYETRIYI